jgi:ATP-dependent RNA helicase RhlE
LSSNSVEKTFADYPLCEDVQKDLAAAGYVTPTPIQAACLEYGFEGKDVIGLAQTGTGKTAAFALPMIQRVSKKLEMSALVIAPTRELANQISASFLELGKSAGIRVATLVGGINIKNDYRALQAWPNVLVATPGRLIDHIQSGTIVLSDIEMLAVDEADRMYDMGFMPQVTRILEALPRKRQTLMFTATMPPKVEALVRTHMNEPEHVAIANALPADRAEQKLYLVNEDEKMPLLNELLRKSRGRVIVFARTRRKVDRLARAVRNRRRDVTCLHGDRSQNERDRSMNGFRDGRFKVLVATDIAARGLDVANVEHVINYDFPGQAEDYIHRIGRTARVAESGLATSFVTRDDAQVIRDLERLLKADVELMRTDGSPTELPKKSGPKPKGKSGGYRGRGSNGSHKSSRSGGNSGNRSSGGSRNGGQRRRRTASAAK